MLEKLRAFWAALPHKVQAGLVAFATAFFVTFVHVISESECLSRTCVMHYAGTAIIAGLASLKTFYMTPSADNGK